MSDFTPTRLFDLLPQIYRVRDAEPSSKGTLEALLDVIEQQVGVARQDIRALWDNFFIETCDEWVIPYIGDLVGTNLVHPVVLRSRVDVAKTIHYRRRKGTVPMLEELARDVTGWSAKAVEFFQILGWTQNANHVRRGRGGWFDIHDDLICNTVNTAFDQAAHTADVRTPAQREGWHNIRNIGFFLWRLQSFSMTNVDPANAGQPHQFHFNPLGQPGPLFIQPDIEGLSERAADEDNVRSPISPRRLRSLAAMGDHAVQTYYGQRRGLSIYVDGALIGLNAPVPRQVVFGDLCQWTDPQPGTLVIDARLGRFAFAPGETPVGRITVSYNYGFSGNIGAGPYSRNATTIPTAIVSVASGVLLDKALTDWQANPTEEATIEIQDSRTYSLNLNTLAMPSQTFRLTIRAASGERPTILLANGLTLTGGSSSGVLALEGLLISGGTIDLQAGLSQLSIRNCTLDPGGGLAADGVTLRPSQVSLSVSSAPAAHVNLRVVIGRSIVGGLRVPHTAESLDISDCIVDAQGSAAISGPGGDGDFAARATLRATTIFGKCWLQELELGSDVIFDGMVSTRRKQNGCVRFSYVEPGSETPRRYRCLPSDGASAAEIARLKPSFTSTRFGDPGYGQLSRSGPAEIATGGSDESEIGANFSLKNPLRRQNLVQRLQEYLPFGLAVALIDIT